MTYFSVVFAIVCCKRVSHSFMFFLKIKGSCHSCVQTDILFALFPFKRRMAQKMPRKHAFFDSKKNNCVCARKKSYVVLVFTANFRCRSLQHAVHDELSAPKTDDARILPSGEYSWQTGLAEPEGGCAGSEGRIRKLGST